MYEYRGRALKVALTEWGLFTIPVILLAIFCGFASEDIIESFQRSSSRSTIFLNTLMISFGLLVPFLLNVLLTIGVRKGHATALKIWYIVQLILIVFGILYLLIQLPLIIKNSYNVPKILTMIIIFLSVSLWYKIWSINVIVKFRDELISSTKYSNAYTNYVVYNHPITEKI